MADYDNFLIRKVFHNDDEVDLSFLIEGVVVETIDLSGPRIMLKFNDQFSLIRDERGVKPGDLLKIRLPMGNLWGVGYDMYAPYRILTMPVTAKGEVVMNCLYNDIHQWKQPIAKPRIYKDLDLWSIVSEWDQSDVREYKADYFPVTESYHFLPGERVTLTFRQMAREHAACIYMERGRMCVRSIKKMVEEEPTFTYDYYDKAFPDDVEFDAYHQPMVIYSTPNNNKILEDNMVRYYTGWNMIDGRFDAIRNTDQPVKFVGSKHQLTINNYNVVLVPTVEFTAAGNSWLVAGVMMKLNWYQSDKEHPIDESLPPKALVHTVAHYYSAQKYFMRVKLVNLAEWCEV